MMRMTTGPMGPTMQKIPMPQRPVFSGAAPESWESQIPHLSPELQPIARTFGELVMQDSGAVEFRPRYPKNFREIPHYPKPSNPAQEHMALDLARRLNDLGLQVKLDEHFNVIGKLASNLPANFPNRDKVSTLALTAHLDTTYEQPNANVIPRVHRNYDGNPIVLSERNSIGKRVVLDPADSPALKARIGQDLFTASGETLLGADAKAGVAEILEALRQLQAHNRQHPDKPLRHPELRVVFAVDEETNMLGARTVDLKDLGADFAIDLDDVEPGTINNRSYYGYNVTVKVQARTVHTAEAGRMRMANPMMITSRIAADLPQNQLLENKRQNMRGFIYLDQKRADWTDGEMLILVRDFNEQAVKERVKRVLQSVEKVRGSLGNAPAKVEWKLEREYANQEIDGRSPFATHLRRSAKAVGLTPKLAGFRGCTDAAVWTERGLPTVNLGCGWQNAHQLTEWVSTQDMYKMSQYLLRIIADWPKNGPPKPDGPQKEFPMAWPKAQEG